MRDTRSIRAQSHTDGDDLAFPGLLSGRLR
jgi:hypothetical protein